tara:strand:+ start:1637 stop:3757 length:2121 start_codon:yes stop_codon:yes gene_type:complete
MNKVFFVIEKFRVLPIDQFFSRSLYFAGKFFKALIRRFKDFIFTSYCKNVELEAAFSPSLELKGFNLPNKDLDNLTRLFKHYRNCEFSILGPGLVSFKKIKPWRSLDFNISNRGHALKVNSLIEGRYSYIDWSLDVYSGYRWEPNTWYLKQRSVPEGVDIKTPWEIGRLQFLPQVALLSNHSPDSQEQIIFIKNTILDFISSNPPRFGVQWVCTMDVGIRAANMVVSYLIASNADFSDVFDDQFNEVFVMSLIDHGRHIINNLEYNPNLTSNHYFSNIAGLLYLSSFLVDLDVDEAKGWLAFSVQETMSEILKQFNEDGSNFEGSTSYHRLSTEIMHYSVARILGLSQKSINVLSSYNKDDFSFYPRLNDQVGQAYTVVEGKVVPDERVIHRLYRSAQFTRDVTKPTGEIYQVGDNDSGRFFKFCPKGKFVKSNFLKKYQSLRETGSIKTNFTWSESCLDHSHIISSALAFKKNETDKTGDISFYMIKSILRERSINYEDKGCSDLMPLNTLDENFTDLKYHKSDQFKFSGEDLTNGCTLKIYPKFGLFVFRTNRLYLAVNLSDIGQNGNGGHAHNDKLSFELNVDGKDIFVDPGTYLYTPNVEIRNKFRSTFSHSTICVDGEEQNEWRDGRLGLFSLKNQVKLFCFSYSDTHVDCGISFRGIFQRRTFRIKKDSILIESYCNREFYCNYNDFKVYSDGYGKLINV